MKNKKYEINLKYKNEKGKIRILGEEFIKRNKYNCKIIYNGEEKELSSHILNVDEKDNIEIKLKVYKDINNMSEMFFNCKSLISLTDISKWNTNNVNNMSEMFYNCKSLIALPDISKWNTNNVENMSEMFFNCKSLKSLPDISKWNTNNVNNMSNNFL